MEPLLILTHLTVLLVLGIFFSLLSNKLKIPNTLFLLFIGIIIGHLQYNNRPLIEFPEIFITSIGILALIMIVFDSTNRFKWKQFDNLTIKAAKLALVTFFINFIGLSTITILLFDMGNIFYAMIFAVIVSATSPDLVLSLFKETKNKAVDVLKFESIINTPLTVLVPFIIINFMNSINFRIDLEQSLVHLTSFFQQIITGVGAGVVIGIIVFKFMRKYYSEKLSPLILITSCLLTYIMAENLSGNGVLAVTVLGLFFGNLHIKQKDVLSGFSGMFSNSLIIFVFILLGLMIRVPFNIGFILVSLLLFLISICLRFIAVYLTFPRNDIINFKEKLFMVLNTPKGIASAVVAFSLFSLSDSFFASSGPAQTSLYLILIFFIYSLILSTVVTRFSKYFINVTVNSE